ncbi:MAG TPA: hypothetical protein VFW92_03710 [Candidatus Limnocylindrales bacterium]|nr:hypothetical protein [Candidatus Limnocylindrales bacterium]
MRAPEAERAPADPQLLAWSAVAPSVAASDRAAFAEVLAALEPATGGAAAGRLDLVTCHRVEVYLEGASTAEAAALDAALPHGGRRLDSHDVVRHLARVAVGLDSAILAEDQVLHQLRRSVAAAEGRGTLGGALARAARLSLTAGRRARTYRPAGRPSLADLALDTLERLAGAGRRPDGSRSSATERSAPEGPVLVVGTGEIGRLTLRQAQRRGLAVLVASRDPGIAAALATRVGGRAVPIEGDGRLDSVVGIVVALGGPWRIDPSWAAGVARRHVPTVDLSFPAAVPAALARALGPAFVPVDAIGTSPGDRDPRLAARLEAAVDEAVEAYEAWAGAAGRDAARALAARAEAVRRSALERLWRRLPQVPAEERAQIEGMAQGLADELLGPPLARLGHDRVGAQAKAARELFDL